MARKYFLWPGGCQFGQTGNTEWNHNKSTKNGDNKTNNVPEGWNHRIQHVVGHANPSFTRFIKCLKMEQKHTEHRIGLALSGKIKGNVTQKAESRQRALKTLIDDYENSHS